MTAGWIWRTTAMLMALVIVAGCSTGGGEDESSAGAAFSCPDIADLASSAGIPELVADQPPGPAVEMRGVRPCSYGMEVYGGSLSVSLGLVRETPPGFTEPEPYGESVVVEGCNGCLAAELVDGVSIAGAVSSGRVFATALWSDAGSVPELELQEWTAFLATALERFLQ